MIKKKYSGPAETVFFENDRKKLRGTVMDITERRHIIQSLQRSEDLYKQAQAMSHIGNWTWDLVHNKLEWSDELYRIYGLEPGTPIPNDFIRSLNHPDDVDRIKEIIERSRQTHESYDIYYTIIRQDGSERIVHANGNVWVDGNGQAYKMSGTVQDVTERQKLIQTLQQSEERYKQAQAMAHIGKLGMVILQTTEYNGRMKYTVSMAWTRGKKYHLKNSLNCCTLMTATT